jgi:hypothetical protein
MDDYFTRSDSICPTLPKHRHALGAFARRRAQLRVRPLDENARAVANGATDLQEKWTIPAHARLGQPRFAYAQKLSRFARRQQTVTMRTLGPNGHEVLRGAALAPSSFIQPHLLCALANNRHQNNRLIWPSTFSQAPSSVANPDRGSMK